MAIALDRLPPQSVEAEQSVLGAMLIEKDAILRASEILDPAAFYRDAHRKIFEAILSLNERSEAVDVVTVTEELRRRNQLEEAGGVAYLTTLANLVPTAANVEFYARIVEEKGVLRRLIQASSEIARRAYEGQEEIEDLLDGAEHLIFNLVQRRQRGYVALKEVLVETYERLAGLFAQQGQITGLPTGFKDFDRLTSGLHPSELLIIAARPAQGKTAFCLNIACNVALHQKVGVGIFSLEMSREQLAMRMLSAEANIDGQRLRSGDLKDREWNKLNEAFARLNEAPILIDDTPNIHLMDLRAKARRMKSEHQVGLIIVDYLQLINHSRSRIENRQQEISEISRSLKSLARELQVPVIALSQLSRAVEQRQDKRPMLSDLRESGSLEQDADLVAFIYHNPENGPDSKVVEIIIAKHRQGPTGSIHLCFLKETGVFGSLDKRFQPA